LIAIVTTTVSTASTATAMSQRPTDAPRSRSAYTGCCGGASSISSVRSRFDGGADMNDVRSASVRILGASGASPLCTRTRSARISAAVW
jgi:hypothetical protein